MVDRRLLPDQDALLLRRARALGDRMEFLGQLFPGTQPGELDADVHPLGEPRHADELAREIEDADLLAHVEQEHLAAAPHRAGLEHQPRRLRHRHEVAPRLRVRDRERPAALELALEQRDHRALAAQHVAEAHRDEAGAAAVGARLEQHLAHPLGGPHDAGGAPRLVGRDQHELAHAVALGGLHQAERADHVVEHRLARVGLEQRDVLMGRGVEHQRRTEAPERRLDPGRVLDVGDDHVERQVGVVRGQIMLHVVHAVLGVIEQPQRRGREPGGLTRQLGADRAARAGDQHALPVEERAQGGRIEPHRAAPEQVLEAHVPQPRQRRAPGLGVGEPGQRLDPHPRRVAHARDLAHQRRGRIGGGDHHHLDPELVQHLAEARQRAEHLDALDLLAGQPRVLVEEAHHREAPLRHRAAPRLLDEVHRRRSGAHDQRARQGGAGGRPPVG